MMTNSELGLKMIPAVLDYALEAGSDDMLSAMVDKEFWKGFAENIHTDGTAVDWETFAVEGIDYDDEWVVIAFQFPEPTEMPEPCLGAIFLHKEGKGTKYFTLEMSTGHRWALCTIGQEGQQLCQICEERLSRSAFLALVADYCGRWLAS